MKTHIKLARRNIWRNKRRTLITAASIFFAIFFAIIMESFQTGAWSGFLNSLVENYSGHLQIQNKDYYKNPNINYLMPYSQEIEEELEKIDGVKNFVPVMQGGGLVAANNSTKVGIVMGLDLQNELEKQKVEKNLVGIYFSEEVMQKLQDEKIPENIIEKIKKSDVKHFKDEDDLQVSLEFSKSETKDYLQKIAEIAKFNSTFIAQNKDEVAIGYKLAKYLEVNIGDSIIILGQGYHGASAAGKYKINGLLKYPSAEFNNMIIYMPLRTSQELFSAYETNGTDTTFLINYVKINTPIYASLDPVSEKRTLKIKHQVEQAINTEKLSVVYWQQINKEMTQVAGSKQGSAKIISTLLYLIIGFGVFGTVLMMITERKREFGVMVAIGMKRTKLAAIFVLEMIMLGLVGIVSGMLATLPIVLLGHYFPMRITGEAAKNFENLNVEPILPFANVGFYYIEQATTVIFMIIIVTALPLIKIFRLNVIKSMRG